MQYLWYNVVLSTCLAKVGAPKWSVFHFRLYLLPGNKTNASYVVRWVILHQIVKGRQKERPESLMRKVTVLLWPKNHSRLDFILWNSLVVKTILCSKYCIFFGSYLYIPIFTFLAVSPHLDSSRVFGAWDDNSQLSVQDWFWMHCGWFYFHVFLCWQWFLTPHAHFGDSWGLLKNQFLLE